MSTWAAIAIVAIVGLMTYSMRAVVIVAMANRTDATHRRAWRSAASARPCWLHSRSISLPAARVARTSRPAEALALIVAGVVAWRKKNLIMTLTRRYDDAVGLHLAPVTGSWPGAS